MITLTMDNSWTSIEFSEEENTIKEKLLEEIHKGIGVKEEGYQFAPSYKAGYWDGITPVLERKEARFPTGLTDQVDTILGDLQNTYDFLYEVIDDRPDPLLLPKHLPEEITLHNDVTLRDYQVKALEEVVADRQGVLNLATGCLPASANVLTTKGYKTFEEILNESGIPLDSEEGYKGNLKGISLINGFGEVETPQEITVNGPKETNYITTERGYSVQVSNTHPLMTINSEGEFKWMDSQDLAEGDWIVLRKDDQVFGNNLTANEEDAYMLGMSIADAYLGIEERIQFSNNQKELLDFFKKYFNKIEGLNVTKTAEKRGTSGSFSCSVQNKKIITEYKEKFGLKSALSADKEVPYTIRTAPKSIQVAFLTGYLECEMTIGTDEGSRLGIEVTSASEKMLKQVHSMLLNLGVVATLREKKVKGYEHNWYGRIMVGAEDSKRLLDLLQFKTKERNKSREKFYKRFDEKTRNNQGQRIPFGKELAQRYWMSSKTPHGQRAKLRNAFYTPKYISKKRLRDGIEKYPDGDPTLLSKLKELVKDEYVYTRVVSIERKESEPTYDFYMPKTNSYIAEGIINHNSGKSYSAAGLIRVALDHIQAGETIGFFTDSKQLFSQTHKVLEEALGIRVGQVKSGKYDVEKVNMVMIPTAASALKIDVEKGLSFTPKQMVVKKMATIIAPQFTKGANQRMLLRGYIKNMEIKTKADEAFVQEIEKVLDKSESDAKCIFNLNSYSAQYKELLIKKNKDKYKKKEKMKDFLETVVMGVWDEAHGVRSESYYNVAMACENSLMQVGLTGSIDPKDKLLLQRMRGVFHKVSSVIKNQEMIERGVLANIEVMMVPIRVAMVKGEELDISGYQWQEAYDASIVQNEYRNALGAKMAQMWYEKGEVVLMVVNRIEQGEALSLLLDGLGVQHRFIHGESGQDVRDETIQSVRDGELEVLISSTIIDEGVDIPNLSVLINMAGLRSMRQVLQRSGRVLRRKEDGRSATIVDFLDQTNKYVYSHSNQRIDIYKDEKFPIKILGD